MRVTFSGGRFFFILLLAAILAYGGYRLYDEVLADWMDDRPATLEVRSDPADR